jgi:hypothetical protein
VETSTIFRELENQVRPCGAQKDLFTDRSLVLGISILTRAAALAALHDAAESYPHPKCHPETRNELLDELWGWCTESTQDPSILWIHGPAGAGKSAIMKTLSERLQAVQRLGGTFFFKRGHTTRGNAHVLFATLALQLALNIPELKSRIIRVVERTPTLVARSMDVQLQELIIEPYRAVECSPTRTIIIDGLDECDGKHIQQDLLRFVGASFGQVTLPLRFVIASRPEPHIREVLQGTTFRDLHRSFNIEKSFYDVRAYLESEFARIHHDHATMLMVPNPWPSRDTIEFLVQQSSGYFIYASTVIKFVDDKDHRPTRRLAAIEALEGSDSQDQSPFAALDALYAQILSAIPRTQCLVSILRVISNFNLAPGQIEALLGLEAGDVELSLRGLHSVIHWSQGDPILRFIHASFRDYLNDASRAGDFYLGDPAGLHDLALLFLAELGYTYTDHRKNRTDFPALCVHVRFYGDQIYLIQIQLDWKPAGVSPWTSRTF